MRTEDQTQDEVLKSGFGLQKLVSTTGQPSPAIKLGGAGFKVYRVSLLSKADQFTQNADGSYDAASILDAYRKSSYDQDTLKFDFSSEDAAVQPESRLLRKQPPGHPVRRGWPSHDLLLPLRQVRHSDGSPFPG